MFNHIRQFHKRSKQEQIARQIAAKYGLTEQYEAARRNGLSPLEALEKFDMVTDEDRKLFEEVGVKNSEKGGVLTRGMNLVEEKQRERKLDSKFTRAITIISALALVLSGLASYFSYKSTMKVNSKMYQMSEDMKYEVMELVAILRAIDTKAAVSQLDYYRIDYSEEIHALAKIQSSPGFIVYLHSIEDYDERHTLERQIRQLTDTYLTSRKWSQKVPLIRGMIHIIMETLQQHTDLTESMNMPYDDLLKDLCSDGIFADYDFEEMEKAVEKANRETKAFLEYLMKKGIEDPNVEYFYYEFIECDQHDKAVAAVKKGARSNVSISEIEKKYNAEYQEFIKTYRDGE